MNRFGQAALANQEEPGAEEEERHGGWKGHNGRAAQFVKRLDVKKISGEHQHRASQDQQRQYRRNESAAPCGMSQEGQAKRRKIDGRQLLPCDPEPGFRLRRQARRPAIDRSRSLVRGHVLPTWQSRWPRQTPRRSEPQSRGRADRHHLARPEKVRCPPSKTRWRYSPSSPPSRDLERLRSGISAIQPTNPKPPIAGGGNAGNPGVTPIRLGHMDLRPDHGLHASLWRARLLSLRLIRAAFEVLSGRRGDGIRQVGCLHGRAPRASNRPARRAAGERTEPRSSMISGPCGASADVRSARASWWVAELSSVPKPLCASFAPDDVVPFDTVMVPSRAVWAARA